MLEKLFESLDKKVFTNELKVELHKQFDLAVAEASKKSEGTISEKVEALAEVKAVEMISEKVEDKILELEEKAEEFQAILEKDAKEKESILLDQVDLYLEKVIDEFMDESRDSLSESIKTEKADMIIEAMDAMIVATGVDIIKISESKDSSDSENKLSKSIEKYDLLIEENIKLEKEKVQMMKMGIISEMKKDLNVIESDKFEKLADFVEFEYSSVYLNKLDTIKENLGSSKVIHNKKEKLVENVVKKMDETPSLITSFSHLV